MLTTTIQHNAKHSSVTLGAPEADHVFAAFFKLRTKNPPYHKDCIGMGPPHSFGKYYTLRKYVYAESNRYKRCVIRNQTFI